MSWLFSQALVAASWGGHLLGWETVCAVEADAGRAAILALRQNQGLLPPFPIWDRVETFDGRPWRGLVDVVSCGSPCQGFSAAGGGAGLEDDRSKLILELPRIAAEVLPSYILVENSPRIRRKGLALVIGQLADIGYACRWDTLSARGVGAWHLRRRMFLVAHLAQVGCHTRLMPLGGKTQEPFDCASLEAGDSAHADPCGSQGRAVQPEREQEVGAALGRHGEGGPFADTLQEGSPSPQLASGRQPPQKIHEKLRGSVAQFHRWPAPPDLVRMVHGIPRRMERIEALGDAQVPRVVAAAFTHLTGGLDHG